MDTIDETVLRRLEALAELPQRKLVNQWVISLGLVAVISIALFAAVQTTRPADVLESTKQLHDKTDRIEHDVDEIGRLLRESNRMSSPEGIAP